MNIFHTVVCSMVLGYIVVGALGEPPTWVRIVGAIAVGVWVYIVEKRRERKAAKV